MQLTTRHHDADALAPKRTMFRPARTVALTVAGLLLVFWLDRITLAAPVQHLYYAPIIVASVGFGAAGGSAAALVAVLLYHLANPAVLSFRYGQGDILQIVLFLAVALVSARFASNARALHRLAHTDDLTGLHNLRSFEEQLNEMVRDAQSARTSLAMLVLDVDRLKSMNDRYGHRTGGEVVRAVGHMIAATVPPDAVPCRYGGDEFVVAVPRCTGAEALDLANRLLRTVASASPVLAGRAFPAGTLSISAGVACRSFDTHGPEAASVDAAGDALFHAADEALYAAKASGRSCAMMAGPPGAR